jgi:hypothetical protein
MELKGIKTLAEKIKKDESEPFVKVALRNKKDFKEETLVEVKIEEGVEAVIGVVKANKIKIDVNYMKFMKPQFTTKTAQEWVANNYKIDKIFY